MQEQRKFHPAFGPEFGSSADKQIDKQAELERVRKYLDEHWLGMQEISFDRSPRDAEVTHDDDLDIRVDQNDPLRYEDIAKLNEAGFKIEHPKGLNYADGEGLLLRVPNGLAHIEYAGGEVYLLDKASSLVLWIAEREGEYPLILRAADIKICKLDELI